MVFMLDERQGEPRPLEANHAPGRAGRYLSIEDLSAETGLSVSTLRRLVKRGVLVAHQPGGPRHRLVFAQDAIERASAATRPVGSTATPTTPPPTPTAHPQRGPQPRWCRGS